MTKTILLFGAGKSATVLIDYLVAESAANGWMVIIADSNREQILLKTRNNPTAAAVQIDITNAKDRASLITGADIVISLMPPALHHFIAEDCIAFGKHLLTASYVDDLIRSRADEINSKGLLFICEMGLDPGIDHMSAMQLIHEIKKKGGSITSFKSHCGGLVAPESDDNPWHYKISWNPRNVVMAGKAGAIYKTVNDVTSKDYTQLFTACTEVNVDGLDTLACYPNRDSLSYIPVYELEEARTFIRTTLRYPSFCTGWDAIVKADLANDTVAVNTDGLTFAAWSIPVLHFVTEANRSLLQWLGLFDTLPVPSTAKTSADILQYLLETKLAMLPHDKDMIVMLHEVEYTLHDKNYAVKSSLVVKGEDSLRTAMAKTVGLPLGIAAKLILDGTITLTGLHIPVTPAIYIPVLAELEKSGIKFSETTVVVK